MFAEPKAESSCLLSAKWNRRQGGAGSNVCWGARAVLVAKQQEGSDAKQQEGSELQSVTSGGLGGFGGGMMESESDARRTVARILKQHTSFAVDFEGNDVPVSPLRWQEAEWRRSGRWELLIEVAERSSVSHADSSI